MGVIRRQGIKNALANYAGVLLGYVNLTLIMTKVLSLEEYGLRAVVFQLASFFSIAALLGSSNIINRYFPYFKTDDKRHGGLPSFLLKFTFLGLIVATAILFLLKPVAVNYYTDKAPLLVEYYYIIVPFGASLVLFESLSAYCRVLLKSTIPVYTRELGQRLYTLGILGLLWYKIIDFDIFFKLYLAGNLLGALVLMVYLHQLGEVYLGWKGPFRKFARFAEMTRFGLYTMFNASMNVVIKMTDLLMLTALAFSMSGLAAAGIYNLGMLVANVIWVPGQSVRQIAAPIIADAFKNHDLKKIERIDQKTSMTLLVAGLCFYGIIAINIESVLGVMREKYILAENVVYLVGIARVVELASGMNNRIIMESQYYKLNLWFNGVMLLLVAVTNYFFIPLWEITGAALATTLSVCAMVVSKIIFVKIKFGFKPYGPKTLYAVLMAAGAILLVYILPKSGSWVIDIGYRTSLFLALFGPMVYFSKISPDVNEFIAVFRQRFLKR